MKTVIIQTAFIGDVVLCSSLVEALFKEGICVSLVVRPEAAAVFEKDARVARVHVYDKHGKDGGIKGILSVTRRLGPEEYDTAVIPHRSLRSALLARFARIPERIGFDNSSGSRLFTRKVEYKKAEHEVVRNHALLTPLGISCSPPAPAVNTSQEDKRAADNLFEHAGIDNNDIVVGFAPGSKWFTKQWGVERFQKLAELITATPRCKVVCFGSNDEKGIGDEISRRNPGNIYNAIGLLGLMESAAALKKVRVVVTNDNGLMHLAAAVKASAVAIFGPTVTEFGFSPWGNNHTILEREVYCRPCSIHGTKSCPEKHFRCMKEIEPEEVLTAVKKYICS